MRTLYAKLISQINREKILPNFRENKQINDDFGYKNEGEKARESK